MLIQFYTCVITPSVSCEQDMMSVFLQGGERERESERPLNAFLWSFLLPFKSGDRCVFKLSAPKGNMPERPVGRCVKSDGEEKKYPPS